MAASRSLLIAAATIVATFAGTGVLGGDVAPRVDDDYRALTSALTRDEFDSVAALAARIHELAPDSLLARKAADLGRIARFLGSRDAAPPSPSGVVAERGALRLSLAPDLAFSAAVLGERGMSPLLFGHPAPFTSRLTLMVDGESFAPSPRASLAVSSGTVEGRIIERGVEAFIRLGGDAAPSWHPAAPNARVRIEAVVINRSDRPRSIGARLLLDVVSGFDDAPLARVGFGDGIATCAEWAHDSVPRRLSIGSRGVLLRGLGAKAPSRALLTPLDRAEASAFDFALSPDAALGVDSALALYADPVVVAPGAEVTLICELVPDGDEIDAASPVGIALFSEPEPAMSGATRLLLVMRGGARGAGQAASELLVTPRLDPGLELIEAAPDLADLGSLPPFATIQRSIVVRPDLTRGGELSVSFDVSASFGRGATAQRSTRNVAAKIGAPARVSLSGRVVDPVGRPVPDCDIVVRQGGRDVAVHRSDAAGNYRVDGLAPMPCEVRASRVIYAEKAAKQARAALDDILLDVLLTSETIDDAGIHRLPVVLPGAGRDIVLARSLTRYSMLVVVEWDAPREYLEGLARGMRKAAEFLYAASDGHFTFGRIAIRDCGIDWNHADFWDWANNSVHPNASVGGIRHRYHPQRAPWNTAINFGRQWDSTWEGGGLFTTVVHEFGHYGFGLFDEYLGAPQGVHRGLSYPEMCRCIMGYQYSDHKICFASNHRPYTNQGMWNGKSCWEQLEANHEGDRGGFFAAITTPAERRGVTPPPVGNSLGAALKVVIDDHSTGGRDVPLEIVGTFGRAPGGVPVYTESDVEKRTVYHGVTDGAGRITLMGVHPGDRVSAVHAGARAETTLVDLAPTRLEFSIEPRGEAIAPLVLVTPESIEASGRREFAGATLEIARIGAGKVDARIEGLRPTRVALSSSVAADGRIVAFAGREQLPLSRGSFAIELADPVDGDLHVLVDVVVGEGDVHAFDGSLEVEAPVGKRIAIASTAGPERIATGTVAKGRVVSLAAERGEAFDVEVVVIAPEVGNSFELRSVDPITRETSPIAVESLAPDRFRARIGVPSLIAWIPRN